MPLTCTVTAVTAALVSTIMPPIHHSTQHCDMIVALRMTSYLVHRMLPFGLTPNFHYIHPKSILLSGHLLVLRAVTAYIHLLYLHTGVFTINFFYVSVSMSICVCLPACLPACLPTSLSVCLSMSVSLSVSVCPSVCLCLSVCLFGCPRLY